MTTDHRPDLTFRNSVGRHSWLRLTPAYSMTLVDRILSDHPHASYVLDPFSGTGTTALCAAQAGRFGVGTDINPFLVWLARAKLTDYSGVNIDVLAWQCIDRMKKSKLRNVVEAPPIHNIDRWWSARTLSGLRRLKTVIEEVGHGNRRGRDLLMVAFCRTLIQASNASFGHQSMSFKEGKPPPINRAELAEMFQLNVDDLDGYWRRISGESFVFELDARDISQLPAPRPFELLITSPPYPNRMSYVRELRPYMYWMGYLEEGRQAGLLDWEAIGGTWGVATSRLNTWNPAPHIGTSWHPAALTKVMGQIRDSGAKNGPLMAKYLGRYFEDMYTHIEDVRSVLVPGAPVNYIVGNSSFYGVLVPVEEIYASMFRALGFTGVAIETLRKRSSNKRLFEFNVTGRAPWVE